MTLDSMMVFFSTKVCSRLDVIIFIYNQFLVPDDYYESQHMFIRIKRKNELESLIL
jgi:hypothetical protein